jgi:Flp pilus assembly CpaF family ATPase
MARSGVCCVGWTRCSITLQVPLPDIVSIQTRQANLEGTGEITLRRLVTEALRIRLNSIIVREVRQEKCLDLQKSAIGTTAVHAWSTRSTDDFSNSQLI